MKGNWKQSSMNSNFWYNCQTFGVKITFLDYEEWMFVARGESRKVINEVQVYTYRKDFHMLISASTGYQRNYRVNFFLNHKNISFIASVYSLEILVVHHIKFIV